MKITFLTFIFIFECLISTAQFQEYILTKEQNNRWFDSIKSKSLSDQILLIKNRIIADTNTYITGPYSDVVNVKQIDKEEFLSKFRKLSEGRIIYCFRHKRFVNDYDFYVFYWNNNTSNKKIENLINFINISNIKGIELITNDDKESALFGSRAGFNVIIFDLKKKQPYIKIKRLFDS